MSGSGFGCGLVHDIGVDSESDLDSCLAVGVESANSAALVKPKEPEVQNEDRSIVAHSYYTHDTGFARPIGTP